jgi:hypothetical protein
MGRAKVALGAHHDTQSVPPPWTGERAYNRGESTWRAAADRISYYRRVPSGPFASERHKSCEEVCPGSTRGARGLRGTGSSLAGRQRNAGQGSGEGRTKHLSNPTPPSARRAFGVTTHPWKLLGK